MRVTFIMDGPPETYICGFCGGRHEQNGGEAIGWLSKDKTLCCSEFCARACRHDADAPRFIDDTWLNE